jgi:hypothetical protein
MSTGFVNSGDEELEGEGFVFEEDSGEQVSADLGESGEASKDEKGSQGTEEGEIDPKLDLLAGYEPAEKGEEAEGEEAEGKQEGKGEKKGGFETHPRFQQLHQAAKDAKKDLGAEKEAHANTRKELEEFETAIADWEALFGEFEEPLQAAQNLIDFVNNAEQLAQESPQHRQLISEIFDMTRSGARKASIFSRAGKKVRGEERVERQSRRERSPEKGKESKVADEKPKELSLERSERAEELIDEILTTNGVPKRDASALRMVAMRLIDPDKKVTKNAMKEVVLGAFEVLEWDPKEVIQRKGTTKRPNVGSPSGASMQRGAGGGGKKTEAEGGKESKGGKEEPPATPQDGERKRASLFDGFLRTALGKEAGP